MFTIHLTPKYFMPSSRSSLAIIIKLKVKENFHIAAMLFFYILQKNCLNNSYIFCKDLLLKLTSGP